MHLLSRTRQILVLATLSAALHPSTNSFAQALPQGAPIVIGQSAEFSGQSIAKEGTLGAQAYFDFVNKRGGVNGRRIELKSYDDGRDVKRTAANTEKLINEDKVFALFGYRSTPSVEAALPILTAAHIPMLAPMSGARQIREPLNPLVFHMRASYQQEASKIVEQLYTVGLRKIAILYQDDPFGQDGLEGFEKALKEHGLAAVATLKYDRRNLNVDAAVRTVAQAKPQAVVMACTPAACTDFIKQVKRFDAGEQFYLLSNVTSDDFVKHLGNDGWGVAISQVVPYPWGTGLALRSEFQAALKEATQPVPISYASFEGFIAAKLFVEGLRSAGPNPTREKFINALEAMRDYDLGGFSIRYSASSHNASSYVDMTVIGRDGKFLK